MGWCNWTKEPKRRFGRRVGDGSQTDMQLYNVLLIYLWTSELHRRLGAHIVGSRETLKIWSRWLMLLMHLTKIFHISQKLINSEQEWETWKQEKVVRATTIKEINYKGARSRDWKGWNWSQNTFSICLHHSEIKVKFRVA